MKIYILLFFLLNRFVLDKLLGKINKSIGIYLKRFIDIYIIRYLCINKSKSKEYIRNVFVCINEREESLLIYIKFPLVPFKVFIKERKEEI